MVLGTIKHDTLQSMPWLAGENMTFLNFAQGETAEMLREDLANMGPARLSDVESAQQEIVNAARRLEAEGKIIIARGGSEDAMV